MKETSYRTLGRRIIAVTACAVAIALLILFPLVHAVIVAVNFIAHICVLGLQTITARLPRVQLLKRGPLREEPFVSIHVPAHNEPPEVLKRTLMDLSQLDWKHYEVLVIDNNTTDENLWRPVQEYCEELGPKFRFFHVENLKGFKAGAMNYVRQFMDRRARFIFVVDADYRVNSDALKRALSYVSDPSIGLIQFPQDYWNVGDGNRGIALEFKHFFSGYMTMANTLDCVPSTGTLTLINVEALRAVNGFDTTVITEDADLGFRLSLKGYRSVFANESVGQGLMPHDLESLKKQRWRWAFGNAQILKLNWRRILFGKELKWRQKLGFIAHLTAWFNFNLVPSLSLIMLIASVQDGALNPLEHAIGILSGLTLLSFMVLRFGTMFYSLRQDGHKLGEIWLAFMTHIGLGWIFSASWIKCLFDHRSPFVRTNKFIGRVMPGPLRSTLVELLLGISLFAAAVVLAIADCIIGPMAAAVMCVGRFLIYWVWQQTQFTWRISKEGDGLDDAEAPLSLPVSTAGVPVLGEIGEATFRNARREAA